MKIPFTPQLLGDLIEKGYNWVLASNTIDDDSKNTITLKPLRNKPDLHNLPDGYETYYRITREPMVMACGITDTTVLVEYATGENVTANDVFEDSYFRMSEDFYRQILESLEDYAVFSTDKNGDVNSWNSGAEKILGYTEAEIMGVNSCIFFTQEDIEKDQPGRELAIAISEGRSINERYHVRKDGSKFWGSGLAFPLFDEEHQHRGFTKIMRNRREREEAESEGGDQ